MKKRFAALLLALLLPLSACAAPAPTPTEVETEPTALSVEDLSPGAEESYVVSLDTTAPPTMPEADEPTWYPPGLHLDFLGEKNAENRDENGVYHHPYTGGEMQIDCRISYCDPMETEIALYFFVDGMLQPFRLEAEGELAYVHTIEAEGTLALVHLYFTLITGQAGDSLRVQLCAQPMPDYITGEDLLTGELPLSMGFCSARIRLEVTPPVVTAPAAEDVLLSWSSDTVELNGAERSRLSREYEVMELMVNGEALELLYNVTPEDTLELCFECYTDIEGTQYSLLFLLDGQPVSVDPADWMTFASKAGQKNVVTARISLRDFEDVGKLGVFYICRNRSQAASEVPYREIFLTAAGGYDEHVQLLKEQQ